MWAPFSASLQFYLQDPRFDRMSIVDKEGHVYKISSYVSEYIADLKKAAKKEKRNGTDPKTISNEFNYYLKILLFAEKSNLLLNLKIIHKLLNHLLVKYI